MNCKQAQMGHIGDGGKHHRHDNASVFLFESACGGNGNGCYRGHYRHQARGIGHDRRLAACSAVPERKIRAQCPLAK
jgi:hypothetical protein